MMTNPHKIRLFTWVVSLISAIAMFLPAQNAFSATVVSNPPTAYWLEIQGAIGPAVADYVVRGLGKAAEDKASVVILQMDTPGGLYESMREIDKAILASSVPVATFVYPSGARAASAGTYILYASHFAVMAPGTNLGAATPVSIGVLGSSSEKTGKDQPESTLAHKAINDATAYIRSLAQLRGRNVEWAVQAVVKGESLSAKEALDKHVIDFMSDNTQSLLADLNGRHTEINGKTVTLQTDNIVLKKIKPDWRTRFLSVITDPSIAYLLLLVGVYGLFIEFMSPGVVAPGVLGTIALLIALYALQLLPINYVGLGLILLGIGFWGAEVFVTSHGLLAVAGLVAFVLGSVMLIDTKVPGFGIPLPLILGVSVFSVAFIGVILRMIIGSKITPEVTGREELLSSNGVVEAVEGNRYYVRVKGELWQAESQATLQVGELVAVKSLQGLILKVDPINSRKGD